MSAGRGVRPVLVVKTGAALEPVRARSGDFEDWIAVGMGLARDALAVVAVHAGERLPEASSVAGVVVTGSPAMVSDRAAWSERAAGWLADAVGRDAVPVLGLCYGHQLLAHGLGGEVGPNPNGRETGTLEIEFGRRLAAAADDAAALRDLGPLFVPGRTRAQFSHVEAVLRPPSGAVVLARTHLDPHSALAFGPRQWGVQFHPEFDREIMRGYIEARRGILTSEGHDPDALEASTDDTPETAVVLRRFAELIERD